MNYKYHTALGMLHIEATPTMQALGDQPWHIRIRTSNGGLLLSVFVDESSARSAAEEAIKYLLDITRTHNKSFRIQ